ncbi:MAG: hypothetical protein IKA17_07970 [Clostridia bacterium]|nr:hypothetical protein [Clostridia bacterium]
MRVNKLFRTFKLTMFITVISVFILFVTFIFPVKFCMKSYPKNTDEEFYVIRYDGMKNWWILTGDAEGLDDWNTISEIPVEIKGEDFTKIISSDLYLRDVPTYFILWGKAEIETEYDAEYDITLKQYIVNCTDWDILEKIASRNKFRMNFSDKYLNIYDYKWFDDFRKLFWEYEE